MNRDRDHWTAEEYREYLRTGKEPARRTSPACCQRARPSGVTLADENGIQYHTAHANISLDGMAEEKPKRQKYGNTRVEIDGLKFDSKHEAAVYQELMLRVKAGELKCVCRQVRFDLGGGQHAEEGSRYAYIADFVTIDPKGMVAVVDAKSEATRKNRVYINKKKQMLAEWGLEIIEM